MKILVTGAAGFVGKHLIPELLNHGHTVIGTTYGNEVLPLSHENLAACALDICDADACIEVVRTHNPDACIHLAGLAHTAETQENLQALFATNVAAVANISRALASSSSVEKRKSLLVVSSSFVYGAESAGYKNGQCDEKTPLAPRGAYGFSKLSAEATARMFESTSFAVYIARPFNHIGPGQHPSFVVPGFASKILSASDGDSVTVGNLEATRDFTDVRDIVRGYRLLIEKAPRERVFVFGSGKKVKIRSLFDDLCSICSKSLKTVTAPDTRRIDDNIELFADSSLLRQTIGWEPQISLSQSLRDILEDLTKRK